MGTAQMEQVGARPDVERRVEVMVVGLPELSARTQRSRPAAEAAAERPHPLALPDDAGPPVPTTPDGHVDLVGLRASGQGKRADDFERRLAVLAKLEARLDGCARGERLAAKVRPAEEAGIGRTTLDRWRRQYLKAKSTGDWRYLLNMKSFSQRGRSRRIPRELALACLDTWAHGNGASAAVLYERLVLPYFEMKGEKPPHRSTLALLLKNKRLLPPIVEDFARQGPKRFRELHAPHVRRKHPAPGSWFCGDHRLGDTYVLVPDGQGVGWPRYGRRPCPCGSGRERRRCCSVRRLYWTAIIDVGSAAILAVRLSLQPDSGVVAGALRDAFLGFGLPSEALYLDNGSDWNAQAITGEPGLAQLGIRIVNTVAFRPESKNVEAVFSAFSQRFERLIPAYTGKTAGGKPELTDLQLRDGIICMAAEYVQALGKAVEEWNCLRPIGDRAKPPIEMMPPLTPDRMVSAESLAFLLQGEAKLVVRQGKIKFKGREYLPDELAILSGSKLTVRYDPGRPEAIYVYDLQGKCLAVPELPAARYGAWGEPNLRAKRAGRAQRQAILSWAIGVKGAAPAEAKDALGAYAAVAERQAAIAAAEAARRRQTDADREVKGALEDERREVGVDDIDPGLRAARERRRQLAMENALVHHEVTIYDSDPELQRLRALRRSLQQEPTQDDRVQAEGSHVEEVHAEAAEIEAADSDRSGVLIPSEPDVPIPTDAQRVAFAEALATIREAARLTTQPGITMASVRSVAQGLRPALSDGLLLGLGADLADGDRAILAAVGFAVEAGEGGVAC